MRHHMTVNGPIPFTPEEEAARDAEEAQALADKPLNDWLSAMAQSDQLMPRWVEDHIEADHGGVAANAYQQASYNNKKALRGSKP